MEFTIEYKRSVKKELRKVSHTERVAIVDKIQLLGQNPHPVGSTKLKGSQNLYRIRHSDYRVIYQVLGGILTIVVVRVGHRREIYKNL